ncbi:MAG: ABC transporter permease [Burkholderiaceae bacterium]
MNPHAPQPASPLALLRNLWVHRALVLALTRREIVGRYRGSVFGIFWSFLNPILMLTVFTFVFGEIFQARWSGAQQAGGVDFAAALFAGLLIYNFFAECISKAPTLVLSNSNYVKKVVFPLEVLPVVNLLAALFHLLVAYLILTVLILFSGWQLTATALLVPVVMAPFALLLAGASWILAALGVFLRDIGQVIAPMITALMFLSPVFYPLSVVNVHLKPVYLANPVTFVIEQVRNLMLHGQLPDWQGLALYSAISVAVACGGFYLFQKSRRGFADVL